jgi:predicted patatin/cPLA2 family phospholipase
MRNLPALPISSERSEIMTGLIVEGGASRSYFAIGVMDAMMENKIQIDYITGASAGISNALNYASNQVGRGIKIGLEHLPKKEYSGLRHLINPKNRSLYNIDYVFNKIPNKLEKYDYEAFKKYKGYAEAAVTNVETGKAEYLRVTPDEKDWKTLVASCSLPIMFPICQIDGKKYLDGGIADSVPFERAISVGCDKIIVLLSRERTYTKKEGGEEKYTARLFKKYPEFQKTLINRSNMYNCQREKLFELEKSGRAFVFCPEDTTTWRRTEKDPTKIKAMYDEGYRLGLEKIDELKKYLRY